MIWSRIETKFNAFNHNHSPKSDLYRDCRAWLFEWHFILPWASNTKRMHSAHSITAFRKKAKRYKDSCPMNTSLMVCIKSDLLFIFRLILSLSLSIETNTFVQFIEMLIICWCWNSFVHILNFWCLAWLTRTHFISFKIKIYWCQSPETVVSPLILIINHFYRSELTTMDIDCEWVCAMSCKRRQVYQPLCNTLTWNVIELTGIYG